MDGDEDGLGAGASDEGPMEDLDDIQVGTVLIHKLWDLGDRIRNLYKDLVI